MSKQTEALKLALEALEPFITPNWAGTGVDKANKAYAAIREALAEQQLSEQCRCGKQTNAWCMANTCSKAEQPAQQQEQVAITRMQRGQEILNWNRSQKEPPIMVTRELWVADQLEQFYTSPPASKPWVGLTDEQRHAYDYLGPDVYDAIINTEAKLREKNA